MSDADDEAGFAPARLPFLVTALCSQLTESLRQFERVFDAAASSCAFSGVVKEELFGVEIRYLRGRGIRAARFRLGKENRSYTTYDPLDALPVADRLRVVESGALGELVQQLREHKADFPLRVRSATNETDSLTADVAILGRAAESE